MRDGRQVITGRRFMLVLDFTPGPALLGTQARLDAALRRLLQQVRNVRPGELGQYYLDVCGWDDGIVLFQVPVTWDELA